MAPEPPAVEVIDLVKSYGSRRALSGISFTIAFGEVLALLGPNGAGKTTTVEILEGFRMADSGSVRVLGFDPARGPRAFKQKIGAMLQQGGVYPTMTPREVLRLFAAYYPHPRGGDELLDLVQLQSAADTRVRRLSGGEQQRLSLALALVGRPSVVFLDEPTAGLDPEARRTTWDTVADLRRQGVTILLTTHYLEEAEILADRVAILNDGEIVALDSPGALTHADRTRVSLETASHVDSALIAALPSCGGCAESAPCRYDLEARKTDDLLVELTALLRDLGVLPLSIVVGQRSLEDVFLQLTRDELAV